MGYTHSVCRQSEIPVHVFDAWVADVRRIIRAAMSNGIALHDAVGFDHPYVVARPGPGDLFGARVCFNGSEALKLAGTPLFVARTHVPHRWQPCLPDGRWFDFFKTHHYPYDTAVVASLIALKHRWGYPGVSVGSDGNPQDLLAGTELWKRCFDDEIPDGPWLPSFDPGKEP